MLFVDDGIALSGVRVEEIQIVQYQEQQILSLDGGIMTTTAVCAQPCVDLRGASFGRGTVIEIGSGPR